MPEEIIARPLDRHPRHDAEFDRLYPPRAKSLSTIRIGEEPVGNDCLEVWVKR